MKKMTHRLLLLLLSTLFFPTALLSQTPDCDGLSGEKKAVAQRIMEQKHPYDCCEDTIAECMTRSPVCDLAKRLASYVCRSVERGKSEADILRSLDKRAQSMTELEKTVPIDLSSSSVVGEDKAPVTVVVYACARCPFCAELIPRIYDVVLNGNLKGKVRLYYKPYPITTHPYSKEGGLALIAAYKLNKFWPYLMRIYGKFKDFSPEKYILWATEVGLDGAAFESLMKSDDAVKLLSASKKEGIVNGVESTPTFFIDGRKFGGDLDVDTLVDVMEEEYEMLVNKSP